MHAEPTAANPAQGSVSRASVIVVATDELQHLRCCLTSLYGQDWPDCEIIVIDNASSDGTAEFLAASFPGVVVVRPPRRLGYAAANNLGFQHASGRYLIVLNPDTRAEPGFVRSLVETSLRLGDRALVTSRVCLFDDPTVINTAGNDVHFGLLAACRGLGAARSTYDREEEVASVSGCAFLIPREVLDDVGPFEESIHPYLEDTDLSLRAWLAGYACVVAPNSLVHHKYALRMHPAKFFFVERNRWLVLLRLYRWPTFAVLAPALLTLEVLAWGYAMQRGRAHVAAKARSYLDILRLLPIAMRSRRRIQAVRRRGDRLLLARLEGKLPVSALLADVSVPGRAFVMLNAAFHWYFAVARRLVGW